MSDRAALGFSVDISLENTMVKLISSLLIFWSLSSHAAIGGHYPWGYMSWKSPVADVALLPVAGNTPGDARISEDTFNIYVWNGSAWIDQSGGAPVVPGGSTGDVQYNSGGSFAGDSGLTYDGGGNLTASGNVAGASLNLETSGVLQSTLTYDEFGQPFPIFTDQQNIPGQPIWYSDASDNFYAAKTLTVAQYNSIPGGAGPANPWLVLSLTDYFNQAGFYETTSNGVGLELEGLSVFEANNTGAPGTLAFSSNFNTTYAGSLAANQGLGVEGGNLLFNTGAAQEYIFMGESTVPPPSGISNGVVFYAENGQLLIQTQFGGGFSPVVTQDLGADHIVITPQINGTTPITTQDGAQAISTGVGPSFTHILCIYNSQSSIPGWYRAADGVTPCTF
jgi:hypothetical protein